MTSDISAHHVMGIQSGEAAANVGDMVAIIIGGSKVNCLVVGTDKDKLTLVPLRSIASAGCTFAGSVLDIDTVVGPANFVVQAQGSVPAIVGSLQFPTVQNNSSNTKEREYYRVKTDCKVQLTLSGGEWHDGCIVDISEGGLLVATAWAVQAVIGQTVYVRIFLPRGFPVMTCGVVRRKVECEPNAGIMNAKLVVEFTAMSAKDKQKLVRFIYSLQLKELEKLSKGKP